MQFALTAICPYCKFIPCCKIHLCFQLPIMDGRIAHNGWANCNSPLRVCYPNVGKYHVNACKYVCKHTKKHHGHGMRAFACVVGANCNSPMLQFIHIANLSHIAKFIHVANSPTPQFIHTAICPYCKFIPCYKFVHIVNSSMLQFTHTTICLHRSLKIAGSGRRQRCYV